MKKILIIFLLIAVIGCGQESNKKQNNEKQETEKGSFQNEEKAKREDRENKGKKGSEEIDPKYLADNLPEIKIESKLIKGEGERMFIPGDDNCKNHRLIGANLEKEICGPSIVEYKFEINEKLQEQLLQGSLLIGIYPFKGYKEVYENFNWETAPHYEQQRQDDIVELENLLFNREKEDKFYSSLHFGISGLTGSLNNSKFIDVNNIKGGRQVNGSYGGVEVMSDRAARYKYYGITEDKKYLIILIFTEIYSPAVDKFTKENDEKIDKLIERINLQNNNSKRELNIKAFNEMRQRVEEVYANDLKNNNTIPKLKQLDDLVKSIELVEK